MTNPETVFINTSNKIKTSITFAKILSDEGIITLYLKDTYSQPISNATITVNFQYSNKNLTTTLNTLEDGSLTLNNLSQNSLITFTYSGNDHYQNSSAHINFTLNTTKKTTALLFKNMTTYVVLNGLRNGHWFNATLIDKETLKALPNKTIKIGFNGNIYTRTTNESGAISLQINIGYQSANTFSITFLGDDKYSGTVGVAIIVVNPLSTKISSSKYSYKSNAKTKTIKVTLKLSNGTLISNKKITFTINGKIYIATTNSKGVASITVSLSTKKTYTYTAKFNGDYQYSSSTASNKIIIK